jgi:hypothetical protein
LTLEELRRDAFQCERCGAQFQDDGGPSDTGWIVEADRILCIGCQTSAEDVAYSSRFINTVRRGQAISRGEGRVYPAELTFVAAREAKRLRAKALESDRLPRLDD